MTRTRGFLLGRAKWNDEKGSNYEIHLSQLHRTIDRLNKEHQQGLHRLFDHYHHHHDEEFSSMPFVPSGHDQHADVILLSLSTIYYSIIQLANATLALGTTVREILELETTDFYESF